MFEKVKLKNHNTKIILVAIISSLATITIIAILFVFVQNMYSNSAVNATEIYCNQGSTYKNTAEQFKVCYNSDWKARENVADNILQLQNKKHAGAIITVSVDSKDMNDVLDSEAQNVYVDKVDRNYTVNGLSALYINGKIPPDTKKAVVVFSTNSKTYDIVLVSPADSSFTDSLNEFESFVATFRNGVN